ncbi:hypothetical protein P8452_55839 [Trifolium repens]|nr:hypothetical protein P8452_55839 [Trifolium repens]
MEEMKQFIETSPELGSHYNEVVSPQDVAMYGGLCALATFDRAELKNKVIDNIVFRNFLELVPEAAADRYPEVEQGYVCFMMPCRRSCVWFAWLWLVVASSMYQG